MNDLFKNNVWSGMTNENILHKVLNLIELHKAGALGGKIMPEDSNPGLPLGCRDNYHFFTLPMALNYQRNSYGLWAAATKAFNSHKLQYLFDPKKVVTLSSNIIQEDLVRSKIALQPNNHFNIWIKLCNTINNYFEGDIRNLFISSDFKVSRIKETVQVILKPQLPYLSGQKIFNYWLYVLEQYTDLKLIEREMISVAPDTHVIQSSIKLGLINPEIKNINNIRNIVSDRWAEVLSNTDILPIDIHTPLWLWSRTGFIHCEKLSK